MSLMHLQDDSAKLLTCVDLGMLGSMQAELREAAAAGAGEAEQGERCVRTGSARVGDVRAEPHLFWPVLPGHPVTCRPAEAAPPHSREAAAGARGSCPSPYSAWLKSPKLHSLGGCPYIHILSRMQDTSVMHLHNLYTFFRTPVRVGSLGYVHMRAGADRSLHGC